jgi:hypothetical protein
VSQIDIANRISLALFRSALYIPDTWALEATVDLSVPLLAAARESLNNGMGKYES